MKNRSDTINRPPPQALDVERTLLGSCLTSADSLRLVVDGCRTSDFYSTSNQKIFSALSKMFAMQRPVDYTLLCEYLKSSGDLPACGDEAGVAEIAECLCTVSNIPHYINQLKEKSALRRLAEIGNRLQAQALDPDADAVKIVERMQTEISAINAGAASEIIFVPSWDNIPPEIPATLTIAENKILSPGNLCLIIAGAGHGKSAVCEAVCAAGINPEADSFSFAVNSGGLVCYIDTERSKQDHGRSWLRTMKRASVKNGSMPENLRFELISTLPSVTARRHYLQNIIALPNLRLLLLDGLADFVPDTNDAETSNAFLFWLLSEAKQRDFGIFATLHPNPTDPDKKARGHLGSEAMRRAESVLSIKKNVESGIRTISMDFAHGKNRNDADNAEASFCWEDTAGMFLSCDAPERPKGKTIAALDDVKSLIKTRGKWSFNELKRAIVENTRCSARTAATRITDAVGLDYLIKGMDGTYTAPDRPDNVIDWTQK